jgi:phosphatidylserine/phosphatidylglycerophosphate/cardiolipin synthase-like enzyme
MPTLQELVDRWFIETDSEGGYPPSTHHPDSTVADHTTGNEVTPLVDGEDILGTWYQNATSLESDPDQSELLHAGWVIANFELVEGGSDSNTQTLFERLHDAGIGTHLVFSDHLTNNGNNEDFIEELEFPTACVDTRYPVGGSLHQKFSVFKSPSADRAMVGSADLWLVVRDQRWHEVSVEIEGPAVEDIETAFRQRWNDLSRDGNWGNLEQTATTPDTTPEQIRSRAATATATGSKAVQVLQTYGRDDSTSYTWSETGEFTVWASHLNAIKAAQEYIYIEDQYFIPFGYPPRCEKPPRDQENGHIDADDYDPWSDTVQEADPFYQLGEALKRGVDVIVLTNMDISEGSGPQSLMFAAAAGHVRSLGGAYLKEIVDSEPDSGDLYVGHLTSGGFHVWVHSKLMLCDDEFASIGSANFNRRSLTCDAEMQVGIVDEQGAFVRNLRSELWHDHSGKPQSAFTDPSTGRATFKQAMADGDGKLNQFVLPTSVGEPPTAIGKRAHTYDPYRGPLGV